MAVDWSDEQEELAALLLPLLLESALARAQETLTELEADVDADELQAEMERWADEYALQLAAALTDTTRQAITDRLVADMPLDEALAIVLSESRAEMISITETTRAIAIGPLLAVGLAGLTASFRWDAFADADNFDPNGPCVINDGQVRQAGELFPSGDTEPPAHPGCRCQLSLVV